MRAIGLCFCLALLGCSSSPTHREPDEYTGCAADEQFLTFDDAEPTATVSGSMSPALTQPTSGAAVPFSPKVTLQWSQDANDPGTGVGDVPYMSCNGCCPQFNMGALTTLHLPPISGDAYDLQFFVDGAYVHRAITTLQEWAAPDALWQSWRGKTVSIKIYRAQLLVDALKGGPFVAPQPMTIKVGG
jgi:hypothetical protein